MLHLYRTSEILPKAHEPDHHLLESLAGGGIAKVAFIGYIADDVGARVAVDLCQFPDG